MNDKCKLVQITGSERQIAWAEKIRREKISAVNKDQYLTTATRDKMIATLTAESRSKWFIEQCQQWYSQQISIAYTANSFSAGRSAEAIQETIETLETALNDGTAVDPPVALGVVELLKEAINQQ